MTADGFSLDDKRNPIADNDIEDIVTRFHNLDAEADRTRKDKSFFVPVEEIREKGYDLSINKYKEIEREKVVYESSDVLMERIEKLETEIQLALVELRKMIWFYDNEGWIDRAVAEYGDIQDRENRIYDKQG